MSGRSYDGTPIDGTVQHLSEAPYWQGEGETVEVIDDAPVGEETVEDVPDLSGNPETPDVDSQTTLDDWRWSV